MKTDMSCNDDRIRERLVAHGLRPTRARCRILALLSARREHFTPEAMYDALRAEGTPISIATLYQNLAKLSEAGVIRRFVGPDGVNRYDAVTEPHHHLFCEVCGRMVDVKAKGPLEAVVPEAVFPEDKSDLAGWKIKGRKVEFTGICPACQARLARSA